MKETGYRREGAGREYLIGIAGRVRRVWLSAVFWKKAGMCAMVLACLASRRGAASYDYTTLDYPGAFLTGAFAVDNGTVVGAYWRDSSGGSVDPEVDRAFVYSGGVWTAFAYPGAISNDAEDIDGGHIVGGWIDGNGDHGYLYNGGSWTSLDYPGAQGTWATGVSGDSIVGHYWGAGNPGGHGFLYESGSWATLDYPGAATTQARGIDGENIVGQYSGSNDISHGFIYDGATWSSLDYPGADWTIAQGLGGTTVVGYYGDSTTGKIHGFLYDGGLWTPFDYPGDVDTYLAGIDGGTLVGYYGDFSTGVHALVASPASPVPAPSAVWLVGSGLLSLAALRRKIGGE
jgi:hypothetical protein